MEHLGLGLQITVLGMGLVFGLLALLWALLTLALRLDRSEAEAPASETAEAGPPSGTAGTLSFGVASALPTGAASALPGGAASAAPARPVSAPDALDPDLVAAMLIAVLTHKEVRRRQAAPALRSYWPGSLLHASRWVAAGRARQTRVWQRQGR